MSGGILLAPLLWARAALMVINTAWLAAAPADTQALAPAPGVRDPLFAVLIGLAPSGHIGRIEANRLDAAIKATGRSTKLPIALLDQVTRLPNPNDPRHVVVETRFTRTLDLPVPYKILTYHPGSFRGSPRLVFEEIDLGAVTAAHEEWVDKRSIHRLLQVGEARLYLLREGELEIDIDGWLDKLAGEKLDDTRVSALAVFRFDGRLYGTALGVNRKGEGRSGTLSFADDRILYPAPPELKTIARTFRSEMERLARAETPAPAGADSP